MSHNFRTIAIKRSQKESSLYRLISELIWQASLENKALQGIMVNRVELSPGKSICNVYFYTPQGKAHFESVLDDLKLYKPSIRKAIADSISARYAVDLVFKFDEQFEKTQRIEELIEKVKREDPD